MTENNPMVPLDQWGKAPEVFNDPSLDHSRFTSGIGMAWPILTLMGKTWGWRFRGEERTYSAPNPQAGGAIMPVQFLDVVLVDAGARISKVFYATGYKKGERLPPTCWSADGVTPDAAASEKQSGPPGGCRHNVFGSKLGEQGQKGKACTDNKRLAVVTLSDLENKDFGGPFMLRLPPGSFANYTTYVSVMAGRGFHPFQIVTRLMFDPAVAHPKVQFMPVRPLNNAEGAIVVNHIKNQRTSEMLNDKAAAAFADPDAEADTVVMPTTLAPPATNGSAPPTAANDPWKAPASTKAEPGANDMTLPPHLVRTEPKPTSTPTPEQQQIAALKAQLAEAEKAEAEPEPTPEPTPVLTPEQLEIQALKAKLAEATKKKPGRPRTKPVAPPEGAGVVTQAGNGSDPAPDAPSAVGNAIADRIAGLVGKTQ